MYYPKFLFYTIFLFIITILFFLIVHYYFSGANYWDNLMKMNTLILPFIYSITVLIEYFKTPERNSLTFKQIFKYSFFTMFIGGMSALICVFIFYNIIDPEAGKILAYQQISLRMEMVQNYITNNKNADDIKNAIQELDFLKIALKSNYNLFNFKAFMVFSSVILLFYTTISFIFAQFLKNK